ncbi:MAG: hypothetical protein GTO02_07980, partial [Candidatus Dadabacteria bacterium]|nr:hypothetical protein [Candidatus Dadabacteria bacterium]
GVDIVKVGIFSSEISDEVLSVIKKINTSGIKIVLVFFADLEVKFNNINKLSGSGIKGIMLDTANKERGSLRTILSDKQLIHFVDQMCSAGLMTGLAGSLQISDIEYLLAMDPDYLGFRGALCHRSERTAIIDEMAVRRIRAMIPKKNMMNV